MLRFLARLTILTCASLAACDNASAEAWPDLDDLASPRFLLIVRCRTEPVEGRVLYKVLDVWKGAYSPLAFVQRPPTGYVDTSLGPDGDDRVAGAEVVLFYTRHNQQKEGISRHDMVVPVRDGKLTYPPGGVELFSGQPEYGVEEFKREITSRVEKSVVRDGEVEDGGFDRRLPAGRGVAQRLGETSRARPAGDYSGPWRMLLPAGFEHAVKFTEIEGGLYRLDGEGLRFNGIYEVRDRRLVIVEPMEPRFEGFEWEIRSPYLLTLVGQSERLEQDYRGAVLFRGRARIQHGGRGAAE